MTKMTKRIGAAMLSTALLLGALTGCGGNTSSSTDGDNAASASTENPHITVVLKTLASEYWAYVAKGCEQAGKDLGAEVDVQGATSETAYDEQLSMIETVLNASGTDAMVVAPLQSETVATQIANAEIPIIAIDTNVESDKVLSFVGFDNEAMASMAAKLRSKQPRKPAGIPLPQLVLRVYRATPPPKHAWAATRQVLKRLAALIWMRRPSTLTVYPTKL